MVLHIIVLIFEVLYYSMFMKFARKEGKFWKYLLLFSLITLIGIFTLTNQNLISYLTLVLLMLYGIKYIVRIKISLYDMLLIVIMLLLKLIIEFIIMLIFYELLNINQFISTMIFDFIKISFLLFFKDKIYSISQKFKRLWDNNNFYIRYIFTIGIYVYVIVSIISAFWLILI